MNTRIIRRLLLSLLVLMLLAVPAAADMLLSEGQAELYAEGKLPPAPAVSLVRTKAVTIEDVITEGLMAQSDRIDVSEFGLTITEFSAVYQDLLNNSPDLFFVAGRYQYYYSDDYVMALVPTYKYTGAELTSKIAAYNAAVNTIVADAKKASTAVGQMLRANEYFCLNFEYDLSYTIYSPELLFSEKTGVCQAYMLGYKAVLDRLGITSTAVPSAALNHIWNLVYLDGSWYHVDVTWNDPTPNVALGAFHDNFLRSDAGIIETKHTSWDAISYSATSTKYDKAFWIDLGVPLTALGSKIYYTSFSNGTWMGAVRSYDLSSSSVTNLYTYDVNAYSSWGLPCCANDFRVYFPMGSEVYSVDKSGASLRLEYALGDSSLNICRMVIDGSTLTMFVSASSVTDGEIITVELDAPLSMAISPDSISMAPGETMNLPISIDPAPVEMPALAYASSRPQLVSIDENGQLTAIAPGTATIMAAYSDDLFAAATVTVACEQVLDLPASTTEIRDGAFAGTAAEQVVIPEGALTISSGAFSDSDALLYINLPDSLTSIAADAFDSSENVMLVCNAGSYAHEIAAASGAAYIALEPETTLTAADILAAQTAAEQMEAAAAGL